MFSNQQRHHLPLYDEIIHHINELLMKKEMREKKPLMVAVVGIPGCGKSIAAQFIAAMLGDACVVKMDGFRYSKQQLSQLKDPATGAVRRGAPWAFDSSKLLKALRILQHGTPPVFLPDFEYSIDSPIERSFCYTGQKYVIVEGLYLLYDWDDHSKNISPIWDVSFYLETRVELAMERLVFRNECILGLSSEEAWTLVHSNDLLNCEYVMSSRHRATHIINFSY